MKQQEIDQKIDQEVVKFNNTLNEERLPLNFIDLFRKAAMNISPSIHKIANRIFKSIGEKQIGELTNFEVRVMLNVIRSVEPVKLYKDYKEYVKMDGVLEGLSIAENVAQSKFKEELNKKKVNLMSLAGIEVGNKSRILKTVN